LKILEYQIPDNVPDVEAKKDCPIAKAEKVCGLNYLIFFLAKDNI
jgi:hypothetical protein